MQRIDLIGQRFGCLVVESLAPKRKGQKTLRYWCRCDCGNVVGVDVCNLRNGHVTSCGCSRNTNKIYEIAGSGLCLMKHDTYFWFDLEDIDFVCSHTWFEHSNSFRAGTKINGKYKFFTRLLLSVDRKDLVVDHINRDTRDNRKCNLRICSYTENNRNRLSKNSGVYFVPERNRWRATIGYKGRHEHLGYFFTRDEAFAARRAAEKEYFGEFAPDLTPSQPNESMAGMGNS